VLVQNPGQPLATAIQGSLPTNYGYAPRDAVLEQFRAQFGRTIRKPFDGEILFIEPVELIVLSRRNADG
jgi:hypothetical protein